MNLKHWLWTRRWLSDRQKIEWYPAFWLLRPKVIELAPDWRKIRIKLPHSWVATNTGGSLFGGFQACLADPVAAMSCLQCFPGYAVWTRSLSLDFQMEGSTDLELQFEMTFEQEEQIRQELQQRGRSSPEFDYGYYLADGTLCTLIRAKIAIRPAGYKATKTG
jgi:hypothetical protein